MNILLIGSGGRESAIAWKLHQSPELTQLYTAPGNPGTAAFGQNVSLDWKDEAATREFCTSNNIHMVVVGPEAPLVEGLGDRFAADEALKDILFVGPSAAGAELEGSKDFAKQFMMRHDIPTAAYETFTVETLAEGKAFLETLQPPYVLKADGLAAGKGVLILDDLQEAQQELESMLADAKFGEASSRVVIEEFLSGVEFSVFAVTDGEHAVILPEAKDYKRIGEGDTGLNTGGMGAVSPVPFFDEAMRQQVMDRVITPTVKGLAKDGLPYKGFIFFGLINCDGTAKVIEYNCRMGDPETEVVMARIDEDFLPILRGAGAGTLTDRIVTMADEAATTVMVVSPGYPGSYPKGLPISGVDQVEDAIVFHAGTKVQENQLVTSGGRVLCATGLGASTEEALAKSYDAVGKIAFEGAYYRRDIGKDLVNG